MTRLEVWAPEGLGEIREGDDLTALIGDLVHPLEHGDILVVTSKVVSKAEGRMRVAADREAAITEETVRVVATREHPGGITRIVENRLGIVAAAAGVDASNTPDGTILLLPLDPDASARALAEALRIRFGVAVGVVISDTLGRPWRIGQTDAAIGAAGLHVSDDLRGGVDAQGRPLTVTQAAVADEIAAAADLVKGKTSGCPVAVVRGLGHLVGGLELPGARSLTRTGPSDMFARGSREAFEDGRGAGFRDGYAAGLAARGDGLTP